MQQNVRNAYEEIMGHFEAMTGIYTRFYGERVPAAFAREFRVSVGTHIKAWVGVFYLIAMRFSKPRKYAFETFWHQPIIEFLDPRDVAIIGGRNDRLECRKRGYGFFWAGGIVAAVVLAWQGGRSLPLRLQIRFASALLKRSRTSFFFYEDTLPVGRFFSVVGRSRGCPTICVEHGFAPSEVVMFDGASCQYNLLYAMSQKEIFGPCDSEFFELGPPFDVDYSSETSTQIILVGTGEHDLRPDFYRRSLDAYARIMREFAGSAWSVIYRPHPSEVPADYASHISEGHRSPKTVCLSGPRKIFIGYISSFLYEAYAFGHGVICLLDPDMPKLAFTPHAQIDAACLEPIEEVVRTVHAELRRTQVIKMPPLKDRFFPVLHAIESAHKNRWQ